MAETEFPEGTPTVTAERRVPSLFTSLLPLLAAPIPGIGPLIAAGGLAATGGRRRGALVDNAITRQANAREISTAQARQDPASLEAAGQEARMGSRRQRQLFAAADRQRGLEDRQASIQAAQDQVIRQAEVDRLSALNELRDDSRQITQRLAQAGTSLQKVLTAPLGAAGDTSLIFNTAKILDPESTVREGEFATIGTNPALPSLLRQAAAQMTDKGRLDPQFRIQLQLLALQQFEAEQVGAGIQLGPFRRAAEAGGVEVERFIAEGLFKDIEGLRAPFLAQQARFGGDTEDSAEFGDFVNATVEQMRRVFDKTSPF